MNWRTCIRCNAPTRKSRPSFGVSARTIERRCRVKQIFEAMDRAKAKGRVSVRRSLFRLAANGNIAAWILLAKNLLGYRDAMNTEHSCLAEAPIQIAAKPDLSQLSDEELCQLRAIAVKALPGK